MSASELNGDRAHGRSGREVGQENRARLRAYLDLLVAENHAPPVKSDGTLNARAIALAADIEPQAMSANPGCREMLEKYASERGYALGRPTSKAEIQTTVLERLRVFLSGVEAGDAKLPADPSGILDLGQLAETVGFRQSVLSSNPEAMHLVIAVAAKNGVSVPRFATPREIAGGHKDGRMAQELNAARQRIVMLEAEVRRLAKVAAQAETGRARAEAKLEHLLSGGIGP